MADAASCLHAGTPGSTTPNIEVEEEYGKWALWGAGTYSNILKHPATGKLTLLLPRS